MFVHHRCYVYIYLLSVYYDICVSSGRLAQHCTVFQISGWTQVFWFWFCLAIWCCADSFQMLSSVDSFQMLSSVITSSVCLLRFKLETVSSSSQWLCSSVCLLTCFVPGFFVSFIWAMEEFSSPEAAFVLTLNLVSAPPLCYCSSLSKIPVIFDFLHEIGVFYKIWSVLSNVCAKYF